MRVDAELSWRQHLPVTGLRLFTTGGRQGRPDMAMFRFLNAVTAGQPVPYLNHGKMRRDFACIDDVTRVVSKAERKLDRIANHELLPMRPGDRGETFANVEDLMRDTGTANRARGL